MLAVWFAWDRQLLVKYWLLALLRKIKLFIQSGFTLRLQRYIGWRFDTKLCTRYDAVSKDRCLFAVSAVHFAPYLTGLSSMMQILAAEARCK